MSLAVRMAGISKRFGGLVALDAVSLEVERGSIHAVVGENGAGKTTLMRILYGAERPDGGSIDLFGQRAEVRSSRIGISLGIGMVSQHTSVIPELTCLQNLILGSEPGLWIDLGAAARRADSLAEKLGATFEWHRLASTLSPAGAQKLEILKLLWRNARVLILDEPTAMLAPAEADALFASLARLVAEGATAILVTHRLSEVLGACSRATVLRGGVRIEEFVVADAEPRQIAEAIVGREIQLPVDSHEVSNETLLAMRGIAACGARGEKALTEIDLEVRRGEIVGVAGVDGSGQRELVRILSGALTPQRGTIELAGVRIENAEPRDRIRMGIHTIPEDRHAEGMISDWSVEDNAILGYQRETPIARRGWIDPKERSQFATEVATGLGAKFAGLDVPIRELSGGNQQRIVAARALARSPRLIVAFQPARGLDIAGAADVYRSIRSRCQSGAGAIVVSFELDELERYADRVVVMRSGRLYELPRGSEKDRATIGRLMVGTA